MVTGLSLSFLNVCGQSVRIIHKCLKIFTGTAPKVVEGLQDALVALLQSSQSGFGDKQLVASLIGCLALLADAVFFIERFQAAAHCLLFHAAALAEHHRGILLRPQIQQGQKFTFAGGQHRTARRQQSAHDFLQLLLAPFDRDRQGGVLVVLHDVTQQRKNQEMQREFVANVSHELRTPLTNIRSYAETLSDSAGELPPATEKKFLGVILNESDRMTHIVQDLLTLSRFDSGKDELHLVRFPFDVAVQDLYNAVYMEAQRHDHKMKLRLEPDLPTIVADRERVLQVMMNIVSNSIKYTPNGGHILVSAGREGDRVWMQVDDDGIGIPAKDRPRIFERFYRVDKARSRESGGTGLGLSIAKEIVDRHEGVLELVDREGPGLSMRMELKIEGPSHV